jgi:hypothetical protein
MNDQSLEQALEDVKRAEFERRHGYKPVYPVDAWPDPVSLYQHPNGFTSPSRYQTATFTGEER